MIRSDAGRFWASRVEPFPGETEWYAPPYRTVDGDTLDALRAEVERQEEAARQITAAPAVATEPAASAETTVMVEIAASVRAAGRTPAVPDQRSQRGGEVPGCCGP
ncbi:hypothetical protein GCM10017673_15810 [Streptosporangium violaceochromogenes]|nr:hypothetical protein GCM10017673_15810 [Streptosporangium violaceochromogenes]